MTTPQQVALQYAEEALREIVMICGNPDPSDGEGTTPQEVVGMVKAIAARVRELELERQLFVDVINRVLASATPTQKENPAMFAAWAACNSALMDKQPQPEKPR